MADLFDNELKIIESNTRCFMNSDYMQKMINEELDKLGNDLDTLVQKIKSLVFSDTEEITCAELESCCMKLSLILYDFETQAEYASVRADIAKMLRDDKYNYIVSMDTDSSDGKKMSVSQKQAIANSTIQAETATALLCSHIMKILLNKKTAAYELLATLKKVLSSRMSSNDYNS